MFKKILLAVVVIIAGFLGYVALQPSDGHVVRTGRINAPADVVFAHVNDLHKWQDWSPWAKIDPEAKTSFEGPEAGVGAIFNWDGNREIGKGRMTIVDSRPNEAVKIRLDFAEPMAGTSTADFTLKPVGEQTELTWDMQGERTFFAKIVCTIFNADKMVGDMFEKGFANLNAVVAAPKG
ncbi:MAG: SRPBCC family protein [Hyphomicrobium sp.]